MTEREIELIVDRAVEKAVDKAITKALEQNCPLGVHPDTAQDLINFAQTWRQSRKAMTTGIVATLVGGMLLAIWAGVKAMIK